MDKLKIRCSSIGKIMGTPKKKGDTLTQTAKTYIEDLAKEEIYGFRRSIDSKYLTKGTESEGDAIDLLSEFIDNPFLEKNTKRLENEFITGECDILTPSIVIDTKCSWDAKSFPLFTDKVTDKDYYWQLQGYMWLYDRQDSILAYCLVNTPIELQYNESDSHDYTNIEMRYRVKTFDIPRNNEDIELIKTKVEHCREYFNQLLK